MIKWKGSRGGRMVIGLGITRENVDRLIDDKPIYVKGSEIGIDFDIAIHFGETMEVLIEVLQSGTDLSDVIVRASKG